MKKTDFLGRSLAPLSQALVLLVASTAYAGSYTLNVSVETESPLTSIQVAIDPQATRGEFTGRGGEVSCAMNPVLSGMSAFYRCDETESAPCQRPGQLNAGFVLDEPLVGSVVLFSCEYETFSSKPALEEFVVETVDSALVRTNAADAAPARVVARVSDLRTSR